MGQAKYRTKKNSCAICKPNKMGWEDKKSLKDRANEDAWQEEVDEFIKLEPEEEC